MFGNGDRFGSWDVMSCLYELSKTLSVVVKMFLKCVAKISVFVCVSVIIWSLYLIGVVEDR